MSRTIRDSRSGGVFAVVLIAVLAVACVTLFLRARSAEEAAADRPAEPAEATRPSPFAGADAALSDNGRTRAPDTRAATVRVKLSELKAERAEVDAAVRAAAASVKSRETDIARLRNDIAETNKRIADLKGKYREDPTDEETKNKLYAAIVKLRGAEGEGVEGLETRLQRANASLAETKDISDDLSRKLAALDSAIATAESKAQTVVDYVGLGAAKDAVEKARATAKAVDGLAESTEREAIEVGAERAAAKARRDAALESLLEDLR